MTRWPPWPIPFFVSGLCLFWNLRLGAVAFQPWFLEKAHQFTSPKPILIAIRFLIRCNSKKQLQVCQVGFQDRCWSVSWMLRSNGVKSWQRSSRGRRAPHRGRWGPRRCIRDAQLWSHWGPGCGVFWQLKITLLPFWEGDWSYLKLFRNRNFLLVRIHGETNWDELRWIVGQHCFRFNKYCVPLHGTVGLNASTEGKPGQSAAWVSEELNSLPCWR